MADEWTQTWPKQVGWYWVCIIDDTGEASRSGESRPCEVIHAGSEPKKFWAYVRDGHFLFRSEYKPHVEFWWYPMLPPPLREG